VQHRLPQLRRRRKKKLRTSIWADSSVEMMTSTEPIDQSKGFEQLKKIIVFVKILSKKRLLFSSITGSAHYDVDLVLWNTLNENLN